MARSPIFARFPLFSRLAREGVILLGPTFSVTPLIRLMQGRDSILTVDTQKIIRYSAGPRLIHPFWS